MRNEIVFNKGKLDLTLLFFLARYRLAAWFTAKFPKALIPFDSLVGDPSLADWTSIPRVVVSDKSKWSPPPPGFVKVNVDGAMVKSWHKGGIGGLLRNEEGELLGSFSDQVGSGPPILAELLAIRTGIQLVKGVGLSSSKRVIVESDSRVALDWIGNPSSSTPLFSPLVYDIASLVLETNAILRCVPRAVNWEADALAKSGIG